MVAPFGAPLGVARSLSCRRPRMARKAVVVSRAFIALFGLVSLNLAAGCGSKNTVYYDGGIDALYPEAMLFLTPTLYSFPDTAPNQVAPPQVFTVTNLGLTPSGGISIALDPQPSD